MKEAEQVTKLLAPLPHVIHAASDRLVSIFPPSLLLHLDRSTTTPRATCVSLTTFAMSAPRPSLKLTFGKKKTPTEALPQASPEQPQKATPEAPQPKLKLKLGGQRPPEGDHDGNKPKRPKKKAQPSAPKKRRADAASGDESDAEPAQAKPGPKRLKLIPSKQPSVQLLRIKHKGSVPHRPLGVGYDSEASDTEIDPSIEEQFILRMPPGEDCEYLRQAINERRLDRAQVAFKPLTREGRRAIFKIRDTQYAATLVDLPCIVEGMKSWDKRGFYKSGDISQMLLILGPVTTEKEAMEYPLPKEVDVLDEKTYQYPHGLTPPLKYVRRRRFRNRISTRTIEQVEKEVADLIAKDETALRPPKFELIDSGSLSRAEGMVQSGVYDEEYDDMQDAEGEMEDEMHAGAGGDDLFEDDLAAEMEAALAAGVDEDAATDTAAGQAIDQAGTPSAAKHAEDTSDDESEDTDREGGQDAEFDAEQLQQQRELQEQREEIAEMEQLIREETARWERQTNSILRTKLGKRVQQLKQDLALKKASIGESEADT
jgi:transcription initiation factor TFIID subunit 7